MKRVLRLFVLVAFVPLVVSAVAAQEPARSERRLFVDGQETYNPGYAVGDIAIGDPEVADFKVLSGRRELLLIGKSPGTTTLIIWDQRKVKREEITVVVASREDVQAEKDLKELLADFPQVQVRRLRGQLVVTGTVASERDFQAVQRIADAASAGNLVRVAPGGDTAGPRTADPDAGYEERRGGLPTDRPPTDPGTPPATAKTAKVEYELEILEASVAFGSGSYGTGVEPSGRPLFRQKVLASFDEEGEVYIPWATISPKDAPKGKASGDAKSGVPAAGSPGIRIRLMPRQLQEDGSFTTLVAIETNAPVPGATDPSIMRRARWELGGGPSEPFGLAGAELLAVPEIAQKGSKLGRAMGIAGTVSMLPGVNQAPGVGYAGQVPYYDREKKTQLLALVRPKLVRSR